METEQLNLFVSILCLISILSIAIIIAFKEKHKENKKIKLKTKVQLESLTPKHFACTLPIPNKLESDEIGVLAQQIMKYLAIRGNKWYRVSYREYCKEHHVITRLYYFKQASYYCKSPQLAIEFSIAWRKKLKN